MTEQLTAPPARRRIVAPAIIMTIGIAAVLAIGFLLYRHATGSTNHVALASSPKPVSVVAATAGRYQPSRRYVGAVEPWVSAKVGPQLVAAYVATVPVRPGDAVTRGQVIATLDCRDTAAGSQAVAMQARAAAAEHDALAREAQRTASLLDGKFVSQNEVDQKQADASSKQAQLASLQAQVTGTSLQVADCVLRAPFDGEIGERDVDPGAFVRPGVPIATIVDRHIVRITTEVPEQDFAAVGPGTPVKLHFLATGATHDATISRRAPSADPGTRTTHIEVDFPDPDRTIPAWTTAELTLDVGAPVPATVIPVIAAITKNAKAAVFVIDHGIAHAETATVLGERDGKLFVDPELAAGSQVVTAGRALLDDKDQVAVGP